MEIEVYTKTTNSSQEEFKELLKSEFSKNQGVEEGKVIECTINKVTDNYIYLGSAGLKQEPVLDTREVANLGLLDKIKEGKLKKLKVGYITNVFCWTLFGTPNLKVSSKKSISFMGIGVWP